MMQLRCAAKYCYFRYYYFTGESDKVFLNFAVNGDKASIS